MEDSKKASECNQTSFNLISNRNLQSHLSCLQKNLKYRKTAARRKQIISWTHLTMTNLGLAPRTIELGLILVDRLLFIDNRRPNNMELFCIACIIFVIKYEGDFTQELGSFMHSVYGIVENARSALLELEKGILLAIPHNFGATATISDYVLSLLSSLQLGDCPRSATQRLADSAVKRLIFADDCLEIDHLIAFPILTAVCETADFRRFQRRLACALKKLKATHSLSIRRFHEYACRFLNGPVI
jgi:hypothetical protein